MSVNGHHRLAVLATRQHDVFSLAQLGYLGLTASAVRKRAAAGRLHRVHRRVYSLAPPELLTRNGRFLAAVLACGPGAVLSHRSAAALHELLRAERAGIDVTIPGRAGRRHDGIDVHRSQTLTSTDTTIVEGIPVTTIARTMFDLAAVVPRRQVERAVDQAEILEAFDAAALEAQLQRNPRCHGANIVRAVLAGSRRRRHGDLERARGALSCPLPGRTRAGA